MFLGVDIGTGSSKAVLVDASGRIVDTATLSHEISLPRPNWAEFDALKAWSELASLCAELFARNDASKVAGVCVSAMGPCLIVTDESLTPLRPAILYGIDSRAADEISELNSLFGADNIYADCGKELSSQAVGPKLRWVRNHEPEVFTRARKWFSLSSWLAAKLTGQYVIDHHTASQCDPLYNVKANDWNPQWRDVIVEHLQTPRLVWPAEVVGTVTHGGCEKTGIPVGLPVCAGTVDAWAEAFSAGVRRPGDLMLMYGSTMFFVEVLGGFHAHEKLWTTAGIEAGTLSLAAGMSTSGSLTTWMQTLFGEVPFETLVREAASVPPGADGLVVLPYFAGERTPVFDPDARGLILGLTLRHERGHLFRATYEGIGFGIRQILAFLEEAGEPIQRIVAVGGGTQASLWTQVVSDITGRTQVIPAETIGASYGDALLAAIGTGTVAPDTDWAVASTVVEPSPASAVLYQQLYDTYCELYRDNRSHMHTLSKIQRTDHDDA